MAATRQSTEKADRSVSLEARAFLAILRTAEKLAWGAAEALKPAGLSPTQYNVLRILRGAEPEGLSCHEIGERMVNRDPDITRLLDRLEVRGLVNRHRDHRDRRVIHAHITGEGKSLLAGLDGVIEQLHRRQMGRLSQAQLEDLLARLEQVEPGGA